MNLIFEGKLSGANHQGGYALVMSLLLLLVVTIIGVSSMRGTVLDEKMTRNTIFRERAFEAAEMALLAGEAEVEAFGRIISNTVNDAYNAASPNATQRVALDQLEACEFGTNLFGGQGGICIPAKYSRDYGTEGGESLWRERWMEVDGDPLSNLGVWSNRSRHRRINDADAQRIGAATPSRYIIEFMGFIIADGGDPSTSSLCETMPDGSRGGTGVSAPISLNWPFCDQDSKLFRITALGTFGNNDEARVMLQSTYVIR